MCLHPTRMVQSQEQIRTAKELGIDGVPPEKLYTLRCAFDDEDRPIPLYGPTESKAVYGWIPVDQAGS